MKNGKNGTRLMKGILLGGLLFAAVFCGAAGEDERPIVGDRKPVKIRYQKKGKNASAWSASSVMLTGAVSESMMVNEIARRHPGSEVRILSVETGKPHRTDVRYEVLRNGKRVSSGTAALTGALTESMARNQLSVRHPGMEIRILGMVAK